MFGCKPCRLVVTYNLGHLQDIVLVVLIKCTKRRRMANTYELELVWLVLLVLLLLQLLLIMGVALCQAM